jgi:hypothetical protein
MRRRLEGRLLAEGRMRMIRHRTLVLLVTVAAAVPWPATVKGAAAAARIVVGPNMLVSRDGDFPHVELIVAANPKNAKNLLGGAITYTGDRGTACRAYATTDGGGNWKASEFAEQVEWGGGDPYVAFTPQGTGVVSALAFQNDEKGHLRGFLHVWRSEDGGMSWGKTMNLGYSYDHEQIAVDQTTGKYAGRIYIGVLYGPYPVYLVGVFRSEDDGRSWIGPVEAASGGGTIGINEVNPMVLSDGTLVLPYIAREVLPGKVKFTGKDWSTAWMVLSEDGGVSFGKPRKVQTMQYDLDDKAGRAFGQFPAFAADTVSKDFRDRIYMAWADFRYGPVRVFFAHSEDRGLHWSEPRLLDPNVPKDAMQGQPVVAVNKDGVVAVTWYDTRASKDGSQFDEYFAASLDGGVSFLPPVRISSAASRPRGPGNTYFAPMAGRYKETSYLSLTSAASRWPGGGDYMGLAADRNGVFHPFWADARSGTFQIYTADVSVVVPPKETPPASPATATASPEPQAPARTKVDLDTRVEVVSDPTRYDPATQEVEVPIRLTNISKQAIYPPITVEIVGFDLNDPEIAKYPYPRVTVVNAANGKPGEGAIFNFATALGNLESLEPGAQTGPIVLKFRFEDPTLVPPVRWKFEGMVEESK